MKFVEEFMQSKNKRTIVAVLLLTLLIYGIFNHNGILSALVGFLYGSFIGYRIGRDV